MDLKAQRSDRRRRRELRELEKRERFARSITDPMVSGQHLARIAVEVAAIDPDRGEHIARSITDERGTASPDRVPAWMRARDGQDTAYAYVRTQLARSYTKALGGIAVKVAAADPDRAERIAQSITNDQHSKDNALWAIAMALAVIDPGRAERVAWSITDPISNLRARCSIDAKQKGSDYYEQWLAEDRERWKVTDPSWN
jgi:hypothetical protein